MELLLLGRLEERLRNIVQTFIKFNNPARSSNTSLKGFPLLRPIVIVEGREPSSTLRHKNVKAPAESVLQKDHSCRHCMASKHTFIFLQ